ncbi:hypothetical protein L5B71_08600 [Avibacterium sp. 21-586]|uniref:hypothetical protein n=1 Tax=Avibacterium sp. 21-586 TaxID=2911534 RepID=UPI002246DA6A|nr:hypothetical protein [Avibacterium sp. 21-586]MCW9710894.1 hypothetical protein [Avibacterium sp. 21-586]
MVLAAFILVATSFATLGLILNYCDLWYVPAFFAIASFTFLVSVTYIAQDCEDLGKFKSMNNIYQCQLIKTEKK